jgi:hypothetical protein
MGWHMFSKLGVAEGEASSVGLGEEGAMTEAVGDRGESTGCHAGRAAAVAAICASGHPNRQSNNRKYTTSRRGTGSPSCAAVSVGGLFGFGAGSGGPMTGASGSSLRRFHVSGELARLKRAKPAPQILLARCRGVRQRHLVASCATNRPLKRPGFGDDVVPRAWDDPWIVPQNICLGDINGAHTDCALLHSLPAGQHPRLNGKAEGLDDVGHGGRR